MNKTSIPWVLGPDDEPGYTWNPAIGCKAVSPGCAHCYAARLASTRLSHLPQYAGLAHDGKWTGEVRFFPEKLDEPLRLRKPAGIFVCDMADLFHDGLTNEQIAAVFGVMAACSKHRFYVLTKRPARMRAWFEWVEGEAAQHVPNGWPSAARPYGPQDFLFKAMLPHVREALGDKSILAHDLASAWPLSNVCLGTTIENRVAWSERAEALADVPAAVHFWSCEPLLEEVEVRCPRCGGTPNDHRAGDGGGCSGQFPDWVIIGGESGPKARPFHVEWARAIVQQCKEAGAAPFVKQLGANPRDAYDRAAVQSWISLLGKERIRVWSEHGSSNEIQPMLRARAGADPSEWPEDLCIRQLPTVKR